MNPLPFLDRTGEQRKLRAFLAAKGPGLAVIYGRRRCGKSRLLQKGSRKNDVYFLADQSEPALQRAQMAEEAAKILPGFGEAHYPNWKALLTSLNSRISGKSTVMIDEFPYLAHSAPELASVLQNYVDREMRHKLILCGSSQKMMRGAVLEATAPLYGRAAEILKILPLKPGWIQKALGGQPLSSLKAFSVWGGIPRYWELAKGFPDLESGLKSLVFDRNGVLHNEPRRLLLEEWRSAVQPHSLLHVIASGSHRLSEIASRLGKPPVNLSRPLDNLIELGYVKREIPWGESVKSTKRSLYKLNDPFLQFWYRFIRPNLSALERDLLEEVYRQCRAHFSLHFGEVWEDLARESVPYLKLFGQSWKPASRWWGHGLDGRAMEVDVVAESFDGEQILLGEAKWDPNTIPGGEFANLEDCGKNLPFIKGRTMKYALWIPQLSKASQRGASQAKAAINQNHSLIDAGTVLKALK